MIKSVRLAAVVGSFIALQASPALAALIAYYDFETSSISGGALINQQNPGNSDGVLNGGVSTGQPGLFGESFGFNGTDSFLDLGVGAVRSQIEGTKAWTVSAWVNVNDLDGGKILYRDETVETEGGLRINAGGAPSAFVQDGNAISTFVTAPNPLSVGEWSHVVGIREDFFDGNGWRLYVNGVLTSDPGLAISLGTFTSLSPRIGSELFGRIDEMRIYDSALSEGEVLALFAAGSTGVPAPGALALLGLGLLGFGLRSRFA